MERLTTASLLSLFLLLVGSLSQASSLVVFGVESSSNPTETSLPEHIQGSASDSLENWRDLAYGEALYHYYRQDPYAALMLLEVETARGTFTNSTHYAALLNTELLLHFGLDERADNKIKLLLVQDTLAQTRAMILLRRAEVDYHNGDYDKAMPQLETLAEHPLPNEAEIQRRLLLTNIYTSRKEFSSAEDILTVASLEHPDGGYLGYNLGVVMVRAGQTEDGLEVLRKVVARTHSTDEDEALKDRALLAIGLTELQRHNYAAAISALRLVRSGSPYVKQALHASALAYYFDYEPQRALPFWLRLQQESYQDQTVQESLLFSAHAYEQIGDLASAQRSYSAAVEHFTQLIKELDAVEQSLNPHWPNSLIHQSAPAGSELSTHTIVSLANSSQAALLSPLFAQQQFLIKLNYYQETKILISTFKLQLTELENYKNTAKQQNLINIPIKTDLQIGLKRIAERLLMDHKNIEYTNEEVTALNLEAAFKYFNKHTQQRLAQTQQLEKILNTEINAMAKDYLRLQKNQLKSLLAEAHLATARVQDQLLHLP